MRFRHRTTGVVVNVRDDKPMGPEWEAASSHSGAVASKTASVDESWTLVRLRDEARRRGLSPYGNKADLIDRLT